VEEIYLLQNMVDALVSNDMNIVINKIPVMPPVVYEEENSSEEDDQFGIVVISEDCAPRSGSYASSRRYRGRGRGRGRQNSKVKQTTKRSARGGYRSRGSRGRRSRGRG